MTWSNSAVVLVILLFIFGALVVRNMDLSAYSLEEISTELSELCDQYAQLRAREAKEAEWQAFEQEVREKTQPLIADLERRPGYNPLYQLAMYDLPAAIASRGTVPAVDREMSLELARASPVIVTQGVNTQEPDGRVDLWLIGMVILDGGLLVAIGYMLFWPARKRLFVSKETESLLPQLNRRIERNPDSARFLGARARLLADVGRYDEALADIDRILDQHAHGVNVDKWQEFRETVAQKATARLETRDAEKHA